MLYILRKPKNLKNISELSLHQTKLYKYSCFNKNG